jgi:hypothetical protein
MSALASTLMKAFDRNINDMGGPDMAVYSTGRLACEDLVEITSLPRMGSASLRLSCCAGFTRGPSSVDIWA